MVSTAPRAWALVLLGFLITPAVGGILYNEDDTHRFMLAPAGELRPARLDELVDKLAGTHVEVLSICIGSKRTNYDSKAWEPYWKGFDPALGNDQPIFGDVPETDRPTYRQWLHNMLAIHQAGVDPNARMIERCRAKRISPWISIRMNDVHDAHLARSPLHGALWMERHDLWRYSDRFQAWNDRCFDYGKQEVRDHMMALIREVSERYDMDGLELDWNRFPLHFREGEELKQGEVLTEWMNEVRSVVKDAARARGHRILLVARVPADPEVAIGTGLDAVTWAKRGLIDHLIVAPFWATTDFEIPVEQWRKLLTGTRVPVTAGLEALVRPHPGAQPVENSVALRRGAALSALARGSEGIYLFNYFEVPDVSAELLTELDSIPRLSRRDRAFAVTYKDISIPGKPIPAALPKTLAPDESASFTLTSGPKMGAEKAILSLRASDNPSALAQVEATLNGRPALERAAADRFAWGRSALLNKRNTVEVRNRSASPITLELVMLEIEAASAKVPARKAPASPHGLSPSRPGFNPWPDRWNPRVSHGREPSWWRYRRGGRDSFEEEWK